MLSDMTMNQAASKAIEILHRSYHTTYYSKPGYALFDEWLAYEYRNHSVYDDEYNESPVTVENIGQLDRAWEFLHSEGKTGEYEGLTASVVEAHGGEGEGDRYHLVISLSDGNVTRYFRKNGWYASFDGGYLDGEVEEVFPVERLVTFYE